MYDVVQDYYGKQLQGTDDLKTTACCDISQVPSWLKPLLSNIHPDVLSHYYGCGLVCPSQLQGCKILDLGSGSGRDVYALAQLVGPSGRVVGVDMTDEQLAIAESHKTYHSEVFGYDNVTFLKGYIEKLDELDLEDGYFDVIVSNCVINLSTDKDAVIASVKRLLKPGGEFYFSDVYASRRVPENVATDPVLYGECLGGALYWNDFITIAKRNGFSDPRLVEDRPLAITDPTLASKIGDIAFFSATYRLFNIDSLERGSENYGQTVIYRGTITDSPHHFLLDKDHIIGAGHAYPVSGNTWKMLSDTRFCEHFEFIGDFSKHHGLFDECGRTQPFDGPDSADSGEGSSCC